MLRTEPEQERNNVCVLAQRLAKNPMCASEARASRIATTEWVLARLSTIRSLPLYCERTESPSERMFQEASPSFITPLATQVPEIPAEVGRPGLPALRASFQLRGKGVLQFGFGHLAQNVVCRRGEPGDAAVSAVIAVLQLKHCVVAD
jgi:hypothetical protein